MSLKVNSFEFSGLNVETQYHMHKSMKNYLAHANKYFMRETHLQVNKTFINMGNIQVKHMSYKFMF